MRTELIVTHVMALALGAAIGAVWVARIWEYWEHPRGKRYTAQAPVRRLLERWCTLRFWERYYDRQRKSK